jgi:hypothetical protein
MHVFERDAQSRDVLAMRTRAIVWSVLEAYDAVHTFAELARWTGLAVYQSASLAGDIVTIC